MYNFLMTFEKIFFKIVNFTKVRQKIFGSEKENSPLNRKCLLFNRLVNVQANALKRV